MNRSPTAAAERHLRIVPRDGIVAAVEAKREEMRAFDERTTPAHDPTTAPLQIGAVRTFIDPFRAGRKGFVVTLFGNEEVIVLVPLRSDGSAVQDAVNTLVDVVAHEMEPPPVDD